MKTATRPGLNGLSELSRRPQGAGKRVVKAGDGAQIYVVTSLLAD